jgi:hypothetical protein
MRISKSTYLIVLFLLAFFAGRAQMSVPFSMSPIAVSNSTITSNGGSPIVMAGTGKCLSVSSGLGVLNVNSNGKGEFGASCKETPPVAAIQVSLNALNLYPNPTHSTSILKCEGSFDANLFCQVRVLSLEGRVMMSQLVAMKEMVAGFTINASAYAAGTYVVSVEFMSQQYSKKLIKL